MESRGLRQQRSKPLPRQLHSIFFDNGKLPKGAIELNKDPRIIMLPSFLTESELQWLDRICTQHDASFSQSFTTDDFGRRVVSDQRSSFSLLLGKGQDAHVRAIESRACALFALPACHCEPPQLVRYRAGDFFRAHHDAGSLALFDEQGREIEDDALLAHSGVCASRSQVSLAAPRRLATVLVYLNSVPPAQGATHFPLLATSSFPPATSSFPPATSSFPPATSSVSTSLSVAPSRGAAVLFCNLTEAGEGDIRLTHCAHALNGPDLAKYALNLWVSEVSLQELSLEKAKFTVNRHFPFDKNNSALSRAERATDAFMQNLEKLNCDGDENGEEKGELRNQTLTEEDHIGKRIKLDHREDIIS